MWWLWFHGQISFSMSFSFALLYAFCICMYLFCCSPMGLFLFVIVHIWCNLCFVFVLLIEIKRCGGCSPIDSFVFVFVVVYIFVCDCIWCKLCFVFVLLIEIKRCGGCSPMGRFQPRLSRTGLDFNQTFHNSLSTTSFQGQHQFSPE